MLKKVFPALLLIFFIQISCSNENSTVFKKYNEYKAYPLYQELSVKPGESSFVTLKVEIPEKSYIYGNPKGPGTGKKTEFYGLNNSYVDFGVVKFLKPIQYTARGENKFVWAYFNETKLFLPFIVKKNTKIGKYNIKLEYKSLLCDSSTCTPKDLNINFTINVTSKRVVDANPDDKLKRLFGLASGKKFVEKAVSKKVVSQNDQSFKDEKFSPKFIESSSISGIIQAIIFGLLAGFILNFMPCVLPVVSLKIMSFVKHSGESRKELRKLGFLFSAGIIVSFLFLALLAAFFGYSWGGLFQHPMFIVAMSAFIFALALSMFEVFTINMPSFAGKAAAERDNKYSDAFVKGLLATLLATPCSGPFLGGTLAWALTQPPVVIFVIFISVGVGMALPYMILTSNPKFMKFIPKPGEWMVKFENFMAFLLVFTVIYLMSILSDSYILPLVTFLAIIAFGLWQYGKFGSIFQTRLKRVISTFALIGIITAGYFVSFDYLYKNDKSDIILKGTEFSVKKLYDNKKNGIISIVKFTADWCPNCKLVEKMSLCTDAVKKIIKENNIDCIIADITLKNEPAEKLLKLLGSRSIPFLAIMPPGEDFYKPYVLRDIYSEEDVLKSLDLALKRAKSSGTVIKIEKIDKTDVKVDNKDLPKMKFKVDIK